MISKTEFDKKNKIELSAFSLKLIAMITMFIDHIGAILIYYPYAIKGQGVPEDIYVFYRVLRNIGRAAFPIFCFLLVEGLLHTKNKKKYALRLAGFALLSEGIYDMASNVLGIWVKQNVFFTLLIGFGVICGLKQIRESVKIQKEWQRGLLRLLVLAVGMGVAWLMKTEYSYNGVLIIAAMYEFWQYRVVGQLLGFCVLCSNPFTITGFALPLLYRGKRGPAGKIWQYFCYAFYPLHLLILYLIRITIG